MTTELQVGQRLTTKEAFEIAKGYAYRRWRFDWDAELEHRVNQHYALGLVFRDAKDVEEFIDEMADEDGWDDPRDY